MKTATTLDDATATTLVLRFVRGLHAGAERRCAEHEVILIGSGTDCDLILSDAGVAPHHCLVSVIGPNFSIRPLDATVQIRSRTIGQGDAVVFDAFTPVCIGEAAFALGDASSERWPRLAAPNVGGTTATRMPENDSPRRRRRYAAAGIAFGLAGAVALALASTSLRAPPPPDASVQRTALEQTLHETGLGEVRISEDGRGGFLLRGQAPDAARVDSLKRNLASRGIAADVDLRSGADIAQDVHEILRLSDIDADSAYRGPGEVEIKGHFGDSKSLNAALASRAIKDIDGLGKVSVLNLDRPREEPRKKPGNEKAIVSAVGGKDPYVITADGSRYFAGAELPCGGRLVSVDDGQLMVDNGSGAVAAPDACKPRTAMR
jgi:type III secretion system YscD/HrpQ family protein